MRKDWSPQEERMAKEADVVYFHENHAVIEWRDRLGSTSSGSGRTDVVAACHDEEVARTAKACGFKDVFYAKKSDTDGLTKTVLQAVDFAKSLEKVSKR
jgi:uroporphyrinogen-III synthase